MMGGVNENEYEDILQMNIVLGNGEWDSMVFGDNEGGKMGIGKMYEGDGVWEIDEWEWGLV